MFVWACMCLMYGHARVPCMGMCVSCVWACVCPLFRPWGLRTAPQAWLYLLVILWNSGAAGFVTWFICRFHLGFSSDFRSLSLWSRQLNGLWIDLCRFLTDSMVPHYTLRLHLLCTDGVCSSGGLWMRENRSCSPLRITSDSERLVHWRLQGAAQSRAERCREGVSYSFVGRLRRLRLPGGSADSMFSIKTLTALFREAEKSILNSRTTKR